MSNAATIVIIQSYASWQHSFSKCNKLFQKYWCKLHDHPLDLYEALKHYFEFTKMNDDQMLNTRLNSKGKAVSNVGIARSKCYEDNNKICRQLKLPKISEKMCKSIGTR